MALPVPTIGQPNSTEDQDIADALTGLNSFIGTYRTIHESSSHMLGDLAAATYIFSATGGAVSGTTDIDQHVTPYFYFDDADYTVTSTTPKLRVRAQIATNATQPTITFTVGLYPVTTAGSADTLVFTLGTVVSGSTVAFASPTASTVSQSNSGDFTVPADGAYMFGVVTSGTLTNNNSSKLAAQLQIRSV